MRGGRHSLVLAYHAVSAGWPSTLAVPPDQLRAQLGLLLRRGYEGVTFGQLVLDDAPAKALAVTFDDGCRSVVEHALPILTALGVPGTVFVPTDFVGRPKPMSWPGIDEWTGTPHEDELLCVGWDQLRELRDSGWEVGSHTRSHSLLPRLNDAELESELVGSREALARELGSACRSLAYPYGGYDGRVCAAVRAAGYDAACTMRPGPPDPLSWPRVGVYPMDSGWRFRLKTAPVVGRARASRLAQRLERSRQDRSVVPE